MTILALETGMRRGELVGLLWQHIDLDKRLATCRRPRMASLATCPYRCGRCLRHDKTSRVIPMSGNAVRLAWEHLRGRAGCPDLHFHDLRHDTVSRLFERGLNIVEVSAISGHKELRMLQRYTHLRAADLVHRLG